jgi:CheY-like chemotaxis protein
MAGARKFLLIDDDEAFNFLNRIILDSKIAGCKVDEALNGEAALALLAKQEECPDVILLDLNMPGMDGFELLDEFEKNNKCFGYSKIFILTSSAREEDRLNGFAHKSVVGYLGKPLSDEHVDEILAKAG